MYAKIRLLCITLIIMLLMGLLPVSDNLPFKAKRVYAATTVLSQSIAGQLSVSSSVPSQTLNVGFTVNLPLNTAVTNAVFSVHRLIWSEHCSWWYGPPRVSIDFNGNHYQSFGLPHWPPPEHTWSNRNVTSAFSGYSGGPQHFSFGANAVWRSSDSPWGVATVGYVAAQLQITYQILPTPPSPDVQAARVAAEAALAAANLAAARAQTAVNQTVFGGVPVAQLAHEARALAGSANVAAGAAQAAANQASARAQIAVEQTVFSGKSVAQMAHEIRVLTEEVRETVRTDETRPNLDIRWNSNRTATSQNAETLHIDTSDNRTPANLLRYEVTVNGTVVVNGTGVPSSVLVPIGATRGLKDVTMAITDQAGNVARKTIRIWRL